jgi:hypothetical protein
MTVGISAVNAHSLDHTVDDRLAQPREHPPKGASGVWGFHLLVMRLTVASWLLMTSNKGRTLMRKRLKTTSVAAAALAALALGGSAIAVSATRHTPSSSKKRPISTSVAAEKTSATDTDNVQSGDQTSPDTHSAKASSASTSETPDTGSATENSSGVPDTGSATENSSESDGPGGHEDPAGNVDHQSEGQE